MVSTSCNAIEDLAHRADGSRPGDLVTCLDRRWWMEPGLQVKRPITGRDTANDAHCVELSGADGIRPAPSNWWGMSGDESS